jgi:hypothetical protein
MFKNLRFSRCLVGAVVLTVIQCAGLVAIELAGTGPAQAQFFRDDRYPFQNRHRPRDGGFLQQLFGPFNAPRYERQEESAPQHVDHSHAPSARKPDKDVTPTTRIVVMGDGMADWLAYGLEDAFSDTPEVAIVRKNKQRSGLLRYDTKGDLDWWHMARDILTQEKANYVVMMLGVSDRENIRERDLAKEVEKQKAEREAKIAAAKAAQNENQADKEKKDKSKDSKPDQHKIAAPEPKPVPNGIVEFRSDRWAKVYSRRIDETIAALKSKGVPVFWVGLPSIRGTKSTADAAYLNDLIRARADRAGVNYIDVWDGFVDDSGKYSSYGPDYEGQTRRLRSSDGVFFTKYGARKLAHYVEREIRRYMSNRSLQVTLPTGPLVPVPEGKSAVRPVTGPVVPLTVITGNSDQLLGAAGTRPVYGDAIANDVLVKGEPVSPHSGRTDDFAWKHGGSDANAAQKPAAEVKAPEQGAAVPAATTKPAVRKIDLSGGDQTSPRNSDTKNANKNMAADKSVGVVLPKPKPTQQAENTPKPEHHSAPRRRFTFPFNPLGWLR